jgi:predicted ATPase
MISGNLRAADELGHQCLELAQASGDPNLLLEAHHRQWATKHFMGDYATAEAHIEFGITTYDPDKHHFLTYIYTGHDPGVCCRNYSAEMLWLRGYPDQALARSREAVTLAERVAHPLSNVQAQQSASQVHLLRREPKEARRWLDKWILMSQEFGFALSISVGRFQMGWALAEEGHAAEGVREMREGIAAITATGAANGLPFWLSILARACGESGEASEGLEVLDRALAIAQSGAKCHLAELLRTKGELLLRRDPQDDSAEGWIQQAMTLAHDEETKIHELRAAVSLAHLYQVEERHREARDVLSPIYNWFTEGLDTRDLINAKNLLMQCNRTLMS